MRKQLIENTMSVIEVKYSDLVEIVLLSNRELPLCLENLKSRYPSLTESDLEVFSEHLRRNFIPKFSKKWQEVSRNKVRFYAKHESWLQNTFTIPTDGTTLELDLNVSNESDTDPGAGPSKRSRIGRPAKSFEECCERAKRKKVKSLCETYPQEMINMAADKLKKQEGISPKFSAEQALALLLDAALSKHQYETIRMASKDLGYDIFPRYEIVREAKKKCYIEDTDCTESYACNGLQSLLNHTTKRIFLTKNEEDLAAMKDECTLITKWGCDGSSGHSEYKQRINEEDISDGNLFLTSLVPLHLCDKDDEKIIFWKNKSPSSTRLCRPVQFQFLKETADVIDNEIERMNSEIQNLTETIVEVNERRFKVKHVLLFTMNDGKVAQRRTDTRSNASCFICKATPKEMNNIDRVRNKPVVSSDALTVGLSPLHARIKFMECILHIAYRKSFREWKVNDSTKQQREDEKSRIQKLFKERMGLNIDTVKQGAGNTNDGNMARRFFADPDITAEITGVNVDLIRRFSVILQAINSKANIDAEKFGAYCNDTTDLYLSLYSWYYMPNTVHKVLIHGSLIISTATLPIGMLTEEAQEARNKDYRIYRQYHSRKCSRESTNEDVMNMLLASSDPYILTFRKEFKVKKMLYSDDVKALLLD